MSLGCPRSTKVFHYAQDKNEAPTLACMLVQGLAAAFFFDSDFILLFTRPYYTALLPFIVTQ